MAELKGSFLDALPALIGGTKDGLKAFAQQILDESAVLCPKDTETLVNSRFISDVELDGDRLVITIGYGRGDALNPKTGEHPSEYAVPVHERLEAKHAPPTSAKFLEIPCLAAEPSMGPELQVWISRYVQGERGLVPSFERIR